MIMLIKKNRYKKMLNLKQKRLKKKSKSLEMQDSRLYIEKKHNNGKKNWLRKDQQYLNKSLEL